MKTPSIAGLSMLIFTHILTPLHLNTLVFFSLSFEEFLQSTLIII